MNQVDKDAVLLHDELKDYWYDVSVGTDQKSKIFIYLHKRGISREIRKIIDSKARAFEIVIKYIGRMRMST